MILRAGEDCPPDPSTQEKELQEYLNACSPPVEELQLKGRRPSLTAWDERVAKRTEREGDEELKRREEAKREEERVEQMVEAILEEALPRMEEALEREDVFQVYTTARELHRKTNNPLFESYLGKVTSRGDVLANVEGANVSFRFYQDTLETWYELGVTPVTNVRLPYAYLQLKFG